MHKSLLLAKALADKSMERTNSVLVINARIMAAFLYSYCIQCTRFAGYRYRCSLA